MDPVFRAKSPTPCSIRGTGPVVIKFNCLDPDASFVIMFVMHRVLLTQLKQSFIPVGRMFLRQRFLVRKNRILGNLLVSLKTQGLKQLKEAGNSIPVLLSLTTSCTVLVMVAALGISVLLITCIFGIPVVSVVVFLVRVRPQLKLLPGLMQTNFIISLLRVLLLLVLVAPGDRV